jgi:hypothetical protein
MATVTSKITVNSNEKRTITRALRDQDIISSKAYGELTITGNDSRYK